MDVNECIESNRERAGAARYGNEIWLNIQLTMLEQRLGFTQPVHQLDLMTTNAKFRAMGVIK